MTEPESLWRGPLWALIREAQGRSHSGSTPLSILDLRQSVPPSTQLIVLRADTLQPVPCDGCDGDGERVQVTDGGWGGKQTVPCPDCNGTGHTGLYRIRE